MLDAARQPTLSAATRRTRRAPRNAATSETWWLWPYSRPPNPLLEAVERFVGGESRERRAP